MKTQTNRASAMSVRSTDDLARNRRRQRAIFIYMSAPSLRVVRTLSAVQTRTAYWRPSQLSVCAATVCRLAPVIQAYRTPRMHLSLTAAPAWRRPTYLSRTIIVYYSSRQHITHSYKTHAQKTYKDKIRTQDNIHNKLKDAIKNQSKVKRRHRLLRHQYRHTVRIICIYAIQVSSN